MNAEYGELAAQAENGNLALKAGGISLRGASAAAEARRALMEAAGVSSVEELTRVTLGRPTAGEKSGPSPVVRARVPQALKDRILTISKAENRNESDIIREALAEYVKLRSAS